MEAASQWGSAVAQDAWSSNYSANRGFRQTSRDNNDMEDQLNAGLNYNIYDHNQNSPQNKAMSELNSGQDSLDDASSDLRSAMRSLRNGDSDSAKSYLRDSLGDMKDGVHDLRHGMRDNPNDSRADLRGERTVRDGIDDISDSRQDLRKALHLLGQGKEEEAMKLMRQGRNSLNNGRDDVDSGVDKIEDANSHGRRGGHGGGQGGHCGGDQQPQPPVEPPTEPPCHPEPPCQPPLYDKAERSLIWGDPHLQDANGTNVEDQIQSDKNVSLLKTSDGASITGHTTTFDNPDLKAQEGHDITVFDKEVVNLGDGTRVQMQADGKAYHVDANGNLGDALKDNEVVSSTRDSNDKVTYDAQTRSLNFNFTGADNSTIAGALTGNLDNRGNYLNTEVKTSQGNFGGFMPALKANFTGATVDSQTGAGAFDPTQDGRQRTNADFFVDSLYDQ